MCSPVVNIYYYCVIYYFIDCDVLVFFCYYCICYRYYIMVQLTLCTYNIRGLNFTKVKYIKDLLKLCTIVVLQELWLNDHQISELSSHFQGYNVHGVSAIDISVLLKGRPKGGVAFIYPGTLGEVSLIKTKSNRLCSISLKFDELLIYFFGVYMPWDCNEVNNLNEFDSILNEISRLCTTHNVEHICLLGEMNTDFSRLHSWHTQALNRFVDYEDLYISLYHDNADGLILIQITIMIHFLYLYCIVLYYEALY